jgi:hypothetical protein
MKLSGKLLAFMFVFVVTAQFGYPQQVKRGKPGPAGSWVVIGTIVANFSADHDGIVVTGPFDDFRKIKFKVTDAPLNLIRMQITYDGGTTQKIETRNNISQGGESRVIDLPGAKRSIRRIDFWYDTKGILRGKAKVTIVGMK